MRALGESLVHMPFSQRKFIQFQNGMRRRIESLRPKAEESLELAVDTMMQERVDSFFRVEQGLEEIIKSLVQIEEELGEIRELSGAMRLESRLEFVEDRWDDFDSEIRERPRRRCGGGALVFSPTCRENRAAWALLLDVLVIRVRGF